jgi:hypothetical protein
MRGKVWSRSFRVGGPLRWYAEHATDDPHSMGTTLRQHADYVAGVNAILRRYRAARRQPAGLFTITYVGSDARGCSRYCQILFAGSPLDDPRPAPVHPVTRRMIGLASVPGRPSGGRPGSAGDVRDCASSATLPTVGMSAPSILNYSE